MLLFFFGYEKQDVGKINQDLPVEAEINLETNSSSTAEINVEKEPVVNKGSLNVSELSTIEKDDVIEEVRDALKLIEE